MIPANSSSSKKMVCLCLLTFVLFSGSHAQGNLPLYDSVGSDPSFSFGYTPPGAEAERRELRRRYRLDTLVNGQQGDMQKLLSVLAWVHHRWKHDGSSEPSKPDALTILKEAVEGKSFRCVEYATVLTSALNALGFTARVVGLKTSDAETKRSGAGHVLTEVWLPEFKKWALADGQYNVLPVLRGVPLNAVELRKALTRAKDLNFLDKDGELNGPRKMVYRIFIQPYLYYLETAITPQEVKGANGERKLLTHVMLVPTGAKSPTVFQQTYPINYAVYTHSQKDFYQRPD